MNFELLRPKRRIERLLVVSDNYELSAFLKSLLASDAVPFQIEVDFCYTALNSSPKLLREMGANQIDVKNERTVAEALSRYDMIISLHCKQIFPKRLVESVCCINIHPGFNPYNRGWYSQAFSLINGLPTGATIHLMDADVDHGPIIAQAEVAIEDKDTSLEVYQKILALEKKLIASNIASILEGTFSCHFPSGKGNYNSLSDYRSLCALNLDSVGTLREHLNLLRALSHGNYWNAYFTGSDGKRCFVTLAIASDCND